jgi:hypothetical protein
VGTLMLVLVWMALPARWWAVDLPGTLLAGLYAVAGAALLWGVPWAVRLSRFASFLALVLGACTVAALALSSAQLVGLYGPVGSGGALLLGTVALLVLPYLVALPAVQIALLRPEHADSPLD